MTTIHTNPRTLSAILAGLRLLQREIAADQRGQITSDILEIATDGGTHELYTPAEIDDLCEALNR